MNRPDITNKMLVVDDICVSFDGFTVLDGMTFSVNHGELRFLIGPNGAGKTTLLDIITGKTKPTSGTVIVDDNVDVSTLSEHEIVRAGVGRKFQTPSVFNSLTVYENLEQAIGFADASFFLLTKLHKGRQDKIVETLETIGLADRANVEAGSLSHGQKQWLEIGMLLVQDPKLLLLDEPVAGMTRRERTATGHLVRKIAETRSVVVVEHDMEFVREFADTVTVLHMGSVLAEGPMEQIENDDEVITVYLGRRPEDNNKKAQREEAVINE